MSTTIPLSKPPTATERTSAALARIHHVFPEATNLKLLQAVILEVIADVVDSTDMGLTKKIREGYSAAVVAAGPARGGTTRTPRATPKVTDFVEPLVPIKHIPNYEVSLAGPPDPDILLEVYGAHQLARALDQRSLTDVRKAVALTQDRHPGTKPKPKANKAGLIAYIVGQVTGLGSGSM